MVEDILLRTFVIVEHIRLSKAYFFPNPFLLLIFSTHHDPVVHLDDVNFMSIEVGEHVWGVHHSITHFIGSCLMNSQTTPRR